MTNVETITSEVNMISVGVTKGKAGSVELDVNRVPDVVHAYAYALGYKQLVNRGMSKIDKDDREALMTKARENIEAIYAGKVRIIGATKAKIPAAQMKVARDEAREDVKAALKAAGRKLSRYKPSTITQAANALIASDPSYLERAAAVVAARGKKTTKADADSLIAKLGITADHDEVGSAGNITKGAHQS